MEYCNGTPQFSHEWSDQCEGSAEASAQSKCIELSIPTSGEKSASYVRGTNHGNKIHALHIAPAFKQSSLLDLLRQSVDVLLCPSPHNLHSLFGVRAIQQWWSVN